MKIKTVDFVDVMNIAMMNLLEVNQALISTRAFDAISVSVYDLKAEISLVLKIIQGNAFRDNYKLIIINGNTPCNNACVQLENYETSIFMSKHIVVDEYARIYFKNSKILIPDSASIESLYNSLFYKEKYNNIFWANLCVDYPTSRNAFSHKFSCMNIECEPLHICELFNKDAIDEILITPYKFYNNKYSNAIKMSVSDSISAFIKNGVECFIQSNLS